MEKSENNISEPKFETTRIGVVKNKVKNWGRILGISTLIFAGTFLIVYALVIPLLNSGNNSLEKELKSIQEQTLEKQLELSEGKLTEAEKKRIVAQKEAELEAAKQELVSVVEVNNAIKEELQVLSSRATELINAPEVRIEKSEKVTMETGNFIPTKDGGIDDFLAVNGAEFVKEAGNAFRGAGDLYNVRPELLVCIAQADSSLGNALKSTNNIGNVGNNDRGNVVHYANLSDAIGAIGSVLNNKYLSGNTQLGQLSQGGRNVIESKNTCSTAQAPYKCYATSDYNWNKNVKLCLQNILQDDSIDETFNFRTQ